jgi:hypothetical protein
VENSPFPAHMPFYIMIAFLKEEIFTQTVVYSASYSMVIDSGAAMRSVEALIDRTGAPPHGAQVQQGRTGVAYGNQSREKDAEQGRERGPGRRHARARRCR